MSDSGVREDETKAIKCMIVGDSETGKTLLYKALLNQPIPKTYEPTVFDVSTEQLQFKGDEISFTLWDSAGSHLFDNIRPISYAHTDCFIICYDVNSNDSYKNVSERWLPEIRMHGDGPKVPVIIVGTKSEGDEPTASFLVTNSGEENDMNVQARATFHYSTVKCPKTEVILNKMMELALQKKIDEETPPNPIWKFQSLNVIITGDEKVGKTSIIETCLQEKGSIASAINRKSNVHRLQEYYHDFISNGCEYFLRIIELPLNCTETLYELYEQANLIILCYSIDDPFSFQSVNFHSQNMSQNLSKSVPTILIANKCDLREESDNILIPTADGQELMEEMKCDAFIECSTKTLSSAEKVIATIVDIFAVDNKK